MTTYYVKPTESPLPDRNWYEVIDADNEYHLWIVEHDPLTDHLDCTCEARKWCSHRAAVAIEIATADYRDEQADLLDYARGQF